MEKKYVLAVDQSTQGTKAILFDVNGDLVCRTDLPHRQLINEKGWVSHDLSEIYSNTIQVVKNLVEKAGIQKEEIACLGISNQRETSAAWSRSTGEPLAPAIVWQCSRASEICERIKTNVMIDPDREQKKNGGVVEALQQAILSGQIPAGTEMTQNELAESLGVSRMPVREALMILEYQGLIIRLPNNRIKAADLTEETLRQILALGAQLERQAIRALPQDAMLAGGEMLQHRTLRTVLPYPLHRKLLESIQETYIAFAVSARPTPVNDRLARLLMLDRQGSPDVPDAWNAYEEELLHLILTIRSQYAGTETH